MKEIEQQDGYYDEDGFYILADGSFYDPDGYYFDKDGYNNLGGYYDEKTFKYVPGPGEAKKY